MPLLLVPLETHLHSVSFHYEVGRSPGSGVARGGVQWAAPGVGCGGQRPGRGAAGSTRGGVRRAAPGAGGSGHCGLRAGGCRLPALAALPAPHHPLSSDESGVQPSSPLPLPWRRRLGPASSPREVLPACPHGNPADGAKPRRGEPLSGCSHSRGTSHANNKVRGLSRARWGTVPA